MPKKKNRTLIGVIGIIIVIFGLVGVLPLSLRTGYPYSLIAGVLVVAGVLFFAWSVSD